MRTLIVMGAAAALFAAGAEAAVKTEVGEAQGKHGLVQAEVTFDGNKIQDIKILKESENKILASRVYTDLRQRLIDGGSLNVDTVSGATLTSKALIGAVKDAAEKAGVTLAAVPLAGKTSRRTADLPKDFDVLVIGSGGAGFAAAVTAHDKGARVAILEKMPSVGGNSLISGAELAAANNWVQKKLGIKDSVEQHYFDTMKGGDFRGDPAIVRTLVNNALLAAEWLVKTIGVEFEPDNLFQFGGHSVKRSLIPKGATGQEIISKFLIAAEKRHIPIYKETKVTELVRDAAGRVVGVRATMEGQPYEFRAKRGVVLATGGFAANVKMRSEANSFYGEGFKTTNTPAAQGDGIVMAQKAGAKTLNMDLIQTYPMCDPVSGAIELIDDARFEGAVLVNQNGERFVEELDRRDVMSKAILNQPGKYCYALMNQAVEDRSHALRNHGDEVELFTKTGILKSGKTLEEVAKAFDIPVANLRKTVDKVNEFARTGKDTDFHYRGKFSDMSKGPYWIYRGVPSVHHTMGGLKINTKAQVLDTNDRPIPGLYAAGEITGCTHGTNRLGSNAYADIIVFGRIAGGEAAQNK